MLFYVLVCDGIVHILYFLRNCMKIALRAGLEVPKRKHHLCQYYDEVRSYHIVCSCVVVAHHSLLVVPQRVGGRYGSW